MEPSGSDEPDPSKFTARLLMVEVNFAVGSWFGPPATVTVLVTEVLAPLLSVTVS